MNNGMLSPNAFVDPITRMLLTSDGSTTLLLEAILNRELQVQVSAEQRRPYKALPLNAVQALGLSGTDTAVERHSMLLTAENSVISSNIVVYTPSVAGAGSLSHTIPLGKQLCSERVKHHREMLAIGISKWPEQTDQQTCVYKEYLIYCETGVRLYVFERFNPDWISALIAG